MWTQDALTLHWSSTKGLVLPVWWTKMFHLKVDIKTFIVSRQDNDRTKLHTGAGVVLPRNTFSPWFFPRCVRVLGRDPASGYQVPGRALRNWSHHPHSLYRPDTWAPDPSVRHHSLTRQGTPSSYHLHMSLTHGTSGDLKWIRELSFSFWSAESFVIPFLSLQVF